MGGRTCPRSKGTLAIDSERSGGCRYGKSPPGDRGSISRGALTVDYFRSQPLKGVVIWWQFCKPPSFKVNDLA